MNLTKKTTITILLAIIFLSAILRFYKLGATSFVADEFLDINSSYAYAKTGQWQNWDFNFGRINTENAFGARDSRAWIYKGQVAQILKLRGPSEANARIISVIWGLISVVTLFYIARYFTKKQVIGLISAFLFAISISAIVFDRRLRMYSMFFPIYLIFSWLTFRFLEEKYAGKMKSVENIFKKFGVNIIYFVPMVILGIISLLTHQLSANIIIAFIFYAVINIYFVIKNKKPLLNKYVLGISSIMIGFAALAIFFADKLKIYTKELELFTNHWVYFPKAFSDYSHFILALLFLLAGIYYLYKNDLKKEMIWIGANFFGILLSAMFIWNRNIGEQYIFFIQSFGIILISAGIYGAVEYLGNNLTQLGKNKYLVPLILILIILPNYGYFFEETNTYKQTSESDNPNYKKVFGYFMKNKKEGDVLITRNFRNFYWKDAKIKVFDFGGELSKEKLSLENIQKIAKENPKGWFIISENDDMYISNEAMDYVIKNFIKVSNSEVRGKILVYKWGSL
jgi:hypothetical protein